MGLPMAPDHSGLTEFQIMHRILSASIPALVGPRDHPNPELIHQIHPSAS